MPQQLYDSLHRILRRSFRQKNTAIPWRQHNMRKKGLSRFLPSKHQTLHEHMGPIPGSIGGVLLCLQVAKPENRSKKVWRCYYWIVRKFSYAEKVIKSYLDARLCRLIERARDETILPYWEGTSNAIGAREPDLEPVLESARLPTYEERACEPALDSTRLWKERASQLLIAPGC